MDVDSPITTTFPTEFTTLASLSPQKRIEQLPTLLTTIFSSSSSSSPSPSLDSDLIAYLIFTLDSPRPIVSVPKPSEPLSLVASRPLLSALADRLKALPSNTTNDLKLIVAQTAITLLEPRVVSFEDQDTAFKLVLADALEFEDDYPASARVLDSINLTASSRAVSDEEKTDVWVRIARCYLEVDDPVAAASYINRAKQVLHNVRRPSTRLHYSLATARILDSQKLFLDAANAYHAISYDPLVADDDRLHTLSAAITCAVLAPAGPNRSRTLAKLYKDDRAQDVPKHAILEKIFLDRMLDAREVARFAWGLAPHQKARTADGSTVVERAMREHNLLGASRVYRNIGIDALGALLGVDGETAEQLAASMIQQARLAGYIDQIEGVIFFEGPEGVGKELRRWDGNVRGLAEEAERVTTMIQEAFPEFYAENMVY